MKMKQMSIEVLDVAVKVLGYKKVERVGVITLKDGSRMTARLAEYETPEGQILVNLSRTKNTMEFENRAEAERYYKEKVEFFETEKDMYMKFDGMDEETWEEWNK